MSLKNNIINFANRASDKKYNQFTQYNDQSRLIASVVYLTGKKSESNQKGRGSTNSPYFCNS